MATYSKTYTPDEMQKISDAVWEDPRITPRNERVDGVPCPKCGASITVWIDMTISRGAPRFRTSCAVCSTRGHGKATEAGMRSFTEEEFNAFAEAFSLGKDEQYCPECHGFLYFSEAEIGGASSRHFSITCLRCRSRGQGNWPPEGE